MLKYELKKFFSKTINKVTLTALILVAIILSFLAADSIRYTDTDGGKLTGIGKITAGRRLAADKNQWKGELTPEKITNAAESYDELNQQYPEEIPNIEWGRTVQSYWDILDFAAGIYASESEFRDRNGLAEENLDHIYDTYADNLRRMPEEYGKTPEQKEFLRKQYQKIEMPVDYEAFDSWEAMTIYIQMYIIILVVVIGFLTAGIFDEEFRHHAELVFFTTKYGRSKASRNKIVVGMVTATVVYWTGIGLLSLLSFGMMGGSGSGTLYQLVEPYCVYVMTQGQRYLLIVVCGYIASLLSAAVTMLVTAKTHTAIVAVCVPFFMFCVLLFIGGPLSNVTNIVYFTTDALVNVVRAMKTMHIFQIGNIVFRQIPFVMILYFVVSVILLPLIYRSYSRYGFTKNANRDPRKWIPVKHSRRKRHEKV